jgi:hypothetical protein
MQPARSDLSHSAVEADDRNRTGSAVSGPVAQLAPAVEAPAERAAERRDRAGMETPRGKSPDAATKAFDSCEPWPMRDLAVAKLPFVIEPPAVDRLPS